MGAVGGLLGVGGGAGGSGYASPTAANIQMPVSTSMATTGNTTMANLIAALQAQNGIQNQSSVFNQLQGVANGTGPNPAQTMLNQATGANVANQNALMAGQRGASQNVGMIARQAAQQGANTQQQAAGQAATLQANQSLNALGGMGNLATAQTNQQVNATQANQQALNNAIAAQNNAAVGMQSNINNANASLAGGLQSGQQNMIGNIMGAGGSMVGSLFGGSGAAGMASSPVAASEGGMDVSGAMDAAGDVSAVAAKGGKVSELPRVNMADGGDVASQLSSPASGPQSNVGKYLSSNNAETQSSSLLNPTTPVTAQKKSSGSDPFSSISGAAGGTNLLGGKNTNGTPDFNAQGAGTGALKGASMGAGIGSIVPGIGTLIGAGVGAIGGGLIGGFSRKAEGGGVEVPVMLSKGEQVVPPKDLKAVASGKKNPLSTGKRVPGTPKHPGNDYRNDVVPDRLPEGAVVIPNEVMQSKNPHWEAMKFVRAHMAAGGKVGVKAVFAAKHKKAK